MAARRVSSSYGALALNKDGYPDLQFEDADVCIKLGEQPDQWLLVHSRVLVPVSPFFASAFSDAWMQSTGFDEIKHTIAGADVKLRTLGLKCVEDTYLLEGKAFAGDSDRTTWKFQDSLLAPPGWTKPIPDDAEYRGHSTYAKEAGHAMQMLIALMYGATMTFRMVTARLQREDEKPSLAPHDVNAGYQDILTISAYAEYYDCLDTLAPMLVDILLATTSLWAAISQSPVDWLRLALKFRSSDIFYDAYRHMVAQAYWNEMRLGHRYPRRLHPGHWSRSATWEDAASVLQNSVEELQDLHHGPLGEIPEKMKMLERDLLRLQLAPARAFHGSRYSTFISFLDALHLKAKDLKQSDGSKMNDKSQYLARTTYGQWVLQMLYGEVLDAGFGEHPKKGTGRLNHAVRKLEQAAASDRPTKLFGYESPSLLARTFNLGRRFNHRKQIQAQLEAVVQEAADVIKKTFPEFRTSSRNWGQYSFAEEMIAARPRHDDHYDGYIAYVPRNPTAALNIVAGINISAASSEWLQAVVDATQHYDEEAAVMAEALRAQQDAENADESDEAGEEDDDLEGADHDQASEVFEGDEEEV